MVQALSDLGPAWNPDWSIDDFMHLCELHGTAAAFADKYRQGLIPGLPDVFAPRITAYLDINHVFEMLHRQQMERLLFELRQVPVIILKGTALAYTIYHDPKLRTRSDTDLLINEDDINAVHEKLINLGYEPALSSSVNLLFYQQSYLLRDYR